MNPRLLAAIATTIAAAAVIAGIFLRNPMGRGPSQPRVRPPTTPPPVSPKQIEVPLIGAPIALDGQLKETVWHSAGRTGPFPFAHSLEAARPYSDGRVMRNNDTLFVALYAADEDQRRGVDNFKLAFVDPEDGSILRMSISVDKQLHETREKDGQEQEWISGVKFGVEADGTLDDDSDSDEEWIVEAGIPLKSLGVTDSTPSIKAMFSRCDRPKKATADACGYWGLGADGSPSGILILDESGG